MVAGKGMGKEIDLVSHDGNGFLKLYSFECLYFGLSRNPLFRLDIFYILLEFVKN